MSSNWTIAGIEDSEGQACECCGCSCPKRRIVLKNGEQEVRYGSSCAAFKLIGNKKAGSVKALTQAASAASIARKWLAAGHSPEVVAKGIWNRFGFLSSAKGNAVDIDGVGIVSA